MLVKGPRPYSFNIFPFTSFQLVIHGVYCKGNVSNMAYFYVYLAGDLDLDHDDRRVEFNSAQLASSTIANDYFNFARTLTYASLTTTTIRRIRLRVVGSSTTVGDYWTS
jgi:hypothetical protein